GSTGLCATVAFMDIKSASKAHNMEHKLDERCLSTEYYEPAAIPGGSTAPLYVAPRFPHGTQSAHHRPLGNAWSYDGTTSGRYTATTPTPDPYSEERRETQPAIHKKRPKSRSGSESGSNSGSSRSRSRSRSHSHSSSSSSQSGSSSCSSGTSSQGTDKSCSPHSAPHANNVSPAVQSEDRRPLAICVRNLPVRSSDTSLKDGLFHEYKKHGKVTCVKVVGQAGDRYALVCFKKADDVEKALEESHNKLFFGCKIEVAPCQGYDVEDNEFRPYEAELDEFHPKATRTLFIGNLEKDVTASELRKNFEQFGKIIEIDIKKQGVVSSYAFCQYSDIASVVKAMRTMDGEHLGNNRIKLGFGKSMATNCVWVDGIADTVSEKYLNLQFSQFGSVTHVTVDRERGHALIYFEQVPYAQDAVREMRGVLLRGRKLQVDFASRECQEEFYEHLEKQGEAVSGERPWERCDSKYDTQQRPRAASYSRTANCSTSTPVAAAVGTTVVQGRTAARVQRAGQRYEYYDTEYPDRRYRNYDEFSQGSAASHDDSYEQDPGDKVPCSEEDPAYKRHSLQSVVVSGDVAAPSQLPPPPSSVQHPLDIRHLQKERVHIQSLLDQLESSGDDDGGMSSSAPKKRLKLVSDDCGGMDMCYENHGDVGAPSLVVTTHNHRKSVSEVRRLSDVSGKHCSRRLSTDSASKHGGAGRDVRETSADRLVSVQSYSPHPVCKRRKTGSSTSESEDRISCRSTKHSHHHHHHQHGEPAASTLAMSGGESVDGSRPGTPLCDERPENLLPPTEPRRFPRDRLATEGPLSLPLPRFAAQVLSSTPRLSVSVSGITSSGNKAAPVSSPPTAITSPRPVPSHLQPVVHQPPPSPVTVPPPASPPPRPASLPSSSSSDSELSPPSPTLEERIRSLDEKYEKWSGSRALSAAGGDALAKLDASVSERFRFRHNLLDLDLNELPPSDIVKSVLAKRSVFDEDLKRLENVSDKYEPREFVPYTRPPGCFQSLRIKTDTGLPPAAKGLQYPFPSHPPVLPTTTVATTTATTAAALVSVSSAGVKPSLSVTVPTSATGTMISPEITRTCVAKPVGPLTNTTAFLAEVSRSSVMRPSVTVLTTATGTKPTAEVTSRVPLKLVSSAPIPSPTSAGRVLSPGLSRLPTCVKPSTPTVTSVSVSTALVTDTSRTSSLSIKSTSILTMTMASTVVTSTTFTTSMSTPTTNSSSESTRSNIKPKPCAVSKKEQSSQSQLPSKDKHCDSGRQSAGVKKESQLTFSAGSVNSSKKDKDSNCREQEMKNNSSSSHKSKTSGHVEERRDRKESVGSVCARRDSEKDGEPNDRLRERLESTEKDKRRDRESVECAERDRRKDSHSMDTEKERRKDSIDSLEKDKQKDECVDNLDRRKDVEFNDKDRWKDGHIENVDKDRWKDREENQEKDRQKENHMTDKDIESAVDAEKRIENTEKRSKERRKERGSSSGSPASIGCKRRMSSQDSVDSVPDDAKRLKLEHHKIAERRDSKDSGRSSGSSKRSSSERPRSHGIASASSDTKSSAKLLEDKIREDSKRQQGKDDADRKKESCDKHKSKDKQKRKNKLDRDSPKEMRDFATKSIKDPALDKELSPKSGKKKDDSDIEDKEDGKHKHTKRETKEKKKQVKEEFGSTEFVDEKGRAAKKDRDKRNSSERRKDESTGKDDQKFTSQKKERKSQKKEFSNSDSDSEDGSGDGPKKHSIFDIVDDGPVYISMYDKVKARSTKNMQKQEEERRQGMMREKFDILKKKRAKREEKKRSTSWDEDSDTDNDQVTNKQDGSEDDDSSARIKHLTTSGKRGNRSKLISDTSEDDNTMVRFKPNAQKISDSYSVDSDADQGFADSDDKLSTSKKSATKNDRMGKVALSNSSDCEVATFTPPPQLDQKPSFHGNSVDKGSDVSRKKSHKKKQKRQKNLQPCEDGLEKTVCIKSDLVLDKPEVDDGKPKADGERKKHKRERRKSTHSKSIDSEDSKQTKVRKKKISKPELGVLKAESSLKRDGKMEDIFGPLSDDSECGHVKTSVTPNNGGSGHVYDKLPGKWQVSLVYGSDSDSNASLLGPRVECYTPAAAIMSRPSEKERKRRDKKKRDKKASNVELVEAGRALEAKLLSKTEKDEDGVPVKEETGNNDADVFRFTEGDESLEAATALLLEKAKEKKKKRKKSKEEKQSRREHHHHHHHDKSKSSPERKLSITSSLEDSKPSPLLSPLLPSLEMPVSPPLNKLAADLTSNDALSRSPSHHNSVITPASTTTKSIEKKKPDKFIPGFGTAIDDIIHETAVKSISEFEAPKPKIERLAKEEISGKAEQGAPKNDGLGNEEEKPRAVISQEETEDAVAALLGESFGADFTPDCYVGEGHGSPHNTTHTGTEPALPTDEEEETLKAIEAIDMKPDTPQSEPDLQIDTDTDGDPEPSYSGLRFSGDDHSPRTPDGIDFSRPPKTPDIPSSYYRQQQGAKPFEQDSLLTKPNLQPEPSPSIAKQMSPASESVDEKPVEPLEYEQDQSPTGSPSPSPSILPDRPVSGEEPKSQSEPEPEVAALSSDTSDNHVGHEQEADIVPDIHVPVESDETAIPVPPCITFKSEEVAEAKDIDIASVTPKYDGIVPADDNHRKTKLKEEDNTEISLMCPKAEVELQPTPLEASSSEMDPPSSPCRSPVISKLSPVPVLAPSEILTETPDTVKKEMDVPLKEELKSQVDNGDFGPYQFEDDVASKEIPTDSGYKHMKDCDMTAFKSTESGTRQDKSYISSTKEDSGFVSVIKEEHASDIARESDFSEPEVDMKTDNDFVTNLLASDSMTQSLYIDENSTTALEAHTDGGYSPFKEREMDVVSVIKEPDNRFKTEEEQDPFASPRPMSPTCKESYEDLAVHKDNKVDDKNDLADAIKVDADFWSAKEVNIESVIKKVDALCSSDEMNSQRDLPANVNENGVKLWFDQLKEKSVEPSAPEETKKEQESVDEMFVNLQSQVVPVKEEAKPSAKDIHETKEKDELKACEEQEQSIIIKSPTKELDNDTALSTSPDDKDEPLLSSSSPERDQVVSSAEDETQDTSTDVQSPVSGQTTPRSTSRGGRGGLRGKTQTRITGVTTRRSRLVGGQKPAVEGVAITPVSPRRGGRRSRGSGNKASLQDHSSSPANKKITTDVYEFRDDSEDEGSNSGEKGRPRLILTIKSPQASVCASNVGGKEVQVATKTAPVPIPIVEMREEFPSLATRKSRRLQERDGSRSTVDDVIEDVVRSAGKVTRSATAAAPAAVNAAGIGLRLRRSTRQNIANQRATVVVPEQPRKSPRGVKKQQIQQRRLSETHEESSEEKKKQTDGETVAVKTPESPALDKDTENNSSKSPDSFAASDKTSKSEKDESATCTVSKPAKPSVEEDDGEPTTLIDPVTGLLIPMRESEEGQYIPVTTAPVIIPIPSAPQITTRSLSESQELPTIVAESDKIRVRAHSLPTIPTASTGFQQPPAHDGVPAVSVTQQSHVPVISNSVPKPLSTASVTAPPGPSVVGLRPVGICKLGVQTPASSTKSVPTTLKAHVLQQTTKTAPSQSVSTATKIVQSILPPLPPSATSAAPPSVLPQSSALKVHTVAQPVIKTQAISTTAPVSHSKTREVVVHQSQSQPSSVGVAKSIQSVVPINPKAHLLQAVTGTKSPGGQTVVVAPGQGQMPVVSKIHHVSGPQPPQSQHIAVNMKASSPGALTPKAHLLQAVTGAQQPILTGAVASPPLKAPHLSSQQPVVTGASSSRAAVPKSQHNKGLMDPPKVDVSLGGCIVVPTASPQPRGQVLQAGLPVPAYEASLHAGSGGVVAELLPNPQFVLAQRQQSPPPAHQQGEVVQHVSFPHHMRNPPHDLAPHYVHPQIMYQQYLRAHQEALTAHIPHYLSQGAVRSPLVAGLEVKSEPDSDEAHGSSPPLELRRPSSNGAVARGAGTAVHSLQSPHDRTTDSPQVATVYVHAASRLPHYTPPQQPPPRYYEPGAEPPPAHLRTSRHHHPLPGTEAPAMQPRLQVATPPHASQVPPQADSLLTLLQRYPVMWQGLLALKNDQAAVQMHFVFGNPHVARESLPCNSDGSTPPLRIAQRMRLEQTQVDGVARKMQMDNEHCMLLALPCGRDHLDVLQQSNNLQTGFITYLQQKQAAGIVNIAAPGCQHAAYVVHIFPSCDFANENLERIAPDLLHRVADIAHLLIIIATV
ncbi:Protein split ends, partial [Zootermopsis nevadensis]